MMPEFTYSRLSADFVKNQLERYAISQAVECDFFVSGLHDSYLVRGQNILYIFRVYRNDWRTQQDILFELALLTDIRNQGGSVAEPLPTKKGDYSIVIKCPEGPRLAALFRYAEGVAPGPNILASDASLLGAEIAKIHQRSKANEYTPSRPPLDLDCLLDKSVEKILPYVSDAGQQLLCDTQAFIHKKLEHLPFTDPYTVYCHGDLNPTNFHIKESQITLFDFDQCGQGWRAFEIGKFNSSVMACSDSKRVQAAFLKAYQKINPLTPEELNSIPYFVCVSLVWVMAIHVLNIEYLGIKSYGPGTAYWDSRLNRLKQAVQNAKAIESIPPHER